MYYYKVAVINSKSTKLLTYSHSDILEIGEIIKVPFGALDQQKGIVVEKTKELKTKNIRSIVESYHVTIPRELIKLGLWMQDYYLASVYNVFKTVLPEYVNNYDSEHTNNVQPSEPSDAPSLSPDQKRCIDILSKHQNGTFLLVGETGSGKSRLYLEICREALRQGKSSIILTSQINLTQQLATEARRIFGKDTFIMHSSLTRNQRKKVWLQILNSTNPCILIGARSALFAPINNLGTIIVDEAHDSNYRQTSQPKYDSLKTAAVLAKYHDAKAIFGTATPSVEDRYYFEKNKPDHYLELGKPIFAKKANIDVISGDRKNYTKNYIFSDKAIDRIREAVDNKEQSIVLINRRGTARSAQCNSCSWIAECPGCNIPMTVHDDIFKLICHICGRSKDLAVVCGNCKMPDIRFRGFGTKKIVSELNTIFPGISVGRYDTDMSTLEDNSYAEQILVGTQMLAQGLDISNISTIVAVSADSILNLPDFSSNERTYQLLHQVSGRAGRAGGNRNVIIQTNYPNHRVFQSLKDQDMNAFYDFEIKNRARQNFPPFVFMLKLLVSRKTSANAQKAADKFYKNLKALSGIEVLGPAPAFHEKKSNKYIWQITIKSQKRALLQEIASTAPSGWQFELDPDSLL